MVCLFYSGHTSTPLSVTLMGFIIVSYFDSAQCDIFDSAQCDSFDSAQCDSFDSAQCDSIDYSKYNSTKLAQ